ncbi:hypothetical protein [Sanguibacter massiliensis]|uniref:hypothetical protein n=1 Tax=Sanguibacter massiliensis TaxID=1973217 RepID=UPI0013EB7C8C|nr:hypothetical protein [Sanguibacter massiliensis]
MTGPRIAVWRAPAGVIVHTDARPWFVTEGSRIVGRFTSWHEAMDVARRIMPRTLEVTC